MLKYFLLLILRSRWSQCGWCGVHQVGEDQMSKHHWNTTRVCWKNCRKPLQSQGRGANYLCLPNDPSYLQFRSRSGSYDLLYGTEYETSSGPLSALQDHNVPCAVCYVSTRGTVLTIPCKDHLPFLLDTRVQWLPDGCSLYTLSQHVWMCWSKPRDCARRHWRSKWSSVLPRRGNLHWDCVSSVCSWETTGLCSVYQVNSSQTLW